MKQCRITTKRLQTKNLTAGQMLYAWCLLEEKCAERNTPFCQGILSKLKRRRDKFTNEPAFAASVYSDLRFQSLLNDSQKEIAVTQLMSTYGRLNKLGIPTTGVASACEDSGDEDSDDDDQVEMFLKRFDSKDRGVKIASNMANDIRAMIHHPRLKHKTDIFLHWATQSNTELGLLCNTAVALPVTSVSVERTFSGLKFILNDLRMSMKPDIIDAIMVLRCNT